MLTNLYKTPFPWFGGKSDAAPAVWSALGDVDHYVEPFAGSLAVLLRRPHEANRTYHSETVNDLDGLLVNAWRSIQLSPDATADAASWPVSEADLHARHIALVRWRAERQLEHLMGDPAWHDPVMGGWWMWGQSCWIGSGWCSGTGSWGVDESGRIAKVGYGVHRKLTHIGNDGLGVSRPQARESGVARTLPHLTNDGQGITRAQLREPGVGDYHPMTMPELLRWMRFLSARLRHVRILNGDWSRAVTSGASKSLPVWQGGHVGIFVDPPYGDVRTDGLYAVDSLTTAAEVRAWALARGADTDTRIVLAGFDEEHRELESSGWRAVEWFRQGFLKGGMANTGEGGAGKQQHRERLWLSPACLGAAAPAQGTLF